ncbi:MAG: NIPSNAP family protein [Planctomycetes bacterium]|nr:NIPSNAP family protein [Planctomycetota bacterium]
MYPVFSLLDDGKLDALVQRLFELRLYESHSVKAGVRKIEMFNEGGEIALFFKTGLQPVFFGETLAGERMPNLNYMLCYDDMASRDADRKVFTDSQEWAQMRKIERYKDTLSNITVVFLNPTDYSQL